MLEAKNRPKIAKLDQNRWFTQTHGLPRPENTGPQPTRGQKTAAHGPGHEKNGPKIMCLCKVIQYIFIYIQKIGRKWTNLVKIGSLHRPTACPGQKTLAHGPPGPENGSPWPGPRKKWPENNVFMQSYLLYMSIFKKYLISVPSWSRGFTPAYHTEGLRFKSRFRQKKSFFLFSIFSWT